MPALRERDQDVLQIARHFLLEYAKEEGKPFKEFSCECEMLLLDYHWPGNIRQLLNVIRNIVVLHRSEHVILEMLPPPLNNLTHKHPIKPLTKPIRQTESTDDSSVIRPFWMTKKQTIERAIALCDGNIPKAASLLELGASTVYRKLQTWQAQR